MFLRVYNTAVNGNNDDLNLADHPILPIPQKTIVDSSGKILPVAFARNFDEYPKRYALNGIIVI
jgi:hypothetical protein